MYETLKKPAKKNIINNKVVQCRLLSSTTLAGSGIGGSAAHNKQAHHKIPNEVFEAAADAFQPLIRQRIAQFDSAWNGIFLPEADSHQGAYFAHNGPHANYTQAVNDGLAAALGAGGLAGIFAPAGLGAARGYVAGNLTDNHFRKPGTADAVAGIPSANIDGSNKLT